MSSRCGRADLARRFRRASIFALLLPPLVSGAQTATVPSAQSKLEATTASSSAADPAGPIQTLVDLRDTGYLLGDLLDEKVTLRLPAGVSIDPDSLPLPGRVAPWMEVRAARIDDDVHDGAQHFVVTYQIFAETEQATRVPIPAFKVRLRGAQTRVLEVPAKSFLLSPALPAALADEDRELKPSAAPLRLSATGSVRGLLSGVLAALACGAYLLWVHDRLPFLPRAPGPFARLWRTLRRKRSRAELPPDETAALLRAWHVALNQTAGETLYRATLPKLFERAPYLTPLRQRIEALFENSWNSFYGPVAKMPPSSELLDVLRLAAAHERGVPC